MNDYFLVGILEQFEDTLNLFGKVLPSYFRGARDAAESEFAKIAMNTTRYGLKDLIQSSRGINFSKIIIITLIKAKQEQKTKRK